jgi:hypothetical protein
MLNTALLLLIYFPNSDFAGMDSLFHGLKHTFERDSLKMYLRQICLALAATPDEIFFWKPESSVR